MAPLRKLLLPAALCGLLVVVWLTPPDRAAARQVEAGLRRALVTYAAARALNAVISVAQGTEVALEPGGVGVVFAPGQALDPINDLVEQFSALMLLARSLSGFGSGPRRGESRRQPSPSLSLCSAFEPFALGKPAWMLGLVEKVKCCAIILCNK